MEDTAKVKLRKYSEPRDTKYSLTWEVGKIRKEEEQKCYTNYFEDQLCLIDFLQEEILSPKYGGIEIELICEDFPEEEYFVKVVQIQIDNRNIWQRNLKETRTSEEKLRECIHNLIWETNR